MFERLRQQVSPFLTARRWLIAYSGGLDSHVLLHLLASLRGQLDIPELLAVHVNHQLQPQADGWQQHCADVCAGLDIPQAAHKVSVPAGASVEQAARQQRYQVFESLLQPGDVLMMAHHADDQAETLLYRLCRGAGVTGLAGMPASRALGQGQLLRPLLAETRQQLEAYAQQHGLVWVDDPSNQDVSFDRNYLRQQVLPLLTARWPQAVKTLQRASSHLAQTQHLLAELAALDLAAAETGCDGEQWLNLGSISALSPARQSNLLRHWLQDFSVVLSSYQQAQLEQQLQAQADACPALVVGEFCLRRYRQRLYLTSARLPEPFRPFNWRTTSACDVPGFGTLVVSRPVDIELQVRPRSGGELIQLAGEPHHRRLKTLLQTSAVPPWRRASLPLIYYQEQLLAVAPCWRCQAADQLLPGVDFIF